MTDAALSLPCIACGKIRNYTKYQVSRGHASNICQKCAVKKYNESRTKQTPEEKKKRLSDYYQKNKDRFSVYLSGYREKVRLEMIDAYGGKCSRCGIDDHEVLVLDHINDDAKKDRSENNHNGGYKMYMFLRKLDWPKESHQLLCHNCNFKKEYARRKNAVKKRQAS